MDSLKRLSRVFWAISVWLASSAAALGQYDPAADSAMTGKGQGWLSSSSGTTADQPRDAGGNLVDLGRLADPPRWTVSGEFIILERMDTVHQTLVATYPGAPSPTTQFTVGQGTNQVSSGDLAQGFAGGPKVGLTYHVDNGCHLEFSFSKSTAGTTSRALRPGPTSRRCSWRPAPSCKRPTLRPNTCSGCMRRDFTMPKSTWAGICAPG